MSSDDEDFNPDELEAKSAKEEYDSDPSDTGEHSTSALINYSINPVYQTQLCGKLDVT